MWDAVKADVSNKSMLQQIDIMEKLQEMHCSENADANGHLKITEHFHLMEEECDQLATVGSPVGKVGFLALVLKSIPAYYCPTLQTINTNSILMSRVSTTLNTTPVIIMSPLCNRDSFFSSHSCIEMSADRLTLITVGRVFVNNIN